MTEVSYEKTLQPAAKHCNAHCNTLQHTGRNRRANRSWLKWVMKGNGSVSTIVSPLCRIRCSKVCCSVLQCVAVCCSTLQYVAVCCNVCCSVCCTTVLRWVMKGNGSVGTMVSPPCLIRCSRVCCSVLQYVAIWCSVLCSVVQCGAEVSHARNWKRKDDIVTTFSNPV